MNARVLLISDDASLRQNVAKAIALVPDCQLYTASDIDEARPQLDQLHPAVVFFHLACEHSVAAAASLLEELAVSAPTVRLVALADQADASQTLRFPELGAADYLSRPLNLRRITMLADVLTVRTRFHQDSKATTAPSVGSIGSDRDFLYASPAMNVLVSRAQRVAQLDSTVLLTGETGTGKTRLARLIHELSRRSREPFVTVNCGALAPSLIESELFGHVRGAFTGADRNRAGKCATAGAGTLLLDEVDALPLATQSKLLRAVDERLFEAVGSDESLPLKARLIVASNRSLDEDVQADRFRADLYYRINVLALHLPPLRERREEIQSLAIASANRLARCGGTTAPEITPVASQALQRYDWPGNIRELQNVVERAVAFGGERIDLADLPECLQQQSDCSGANGSIECAGSKWDRSRFEAESQVIVDALTNNANNRSRAARELGISRVTLYKKLHKYGLI